MGEDTELTQWPEPVVPTLPNEEIVRLGEEIYERHIRHRVEANHHGRIVVIDVDSGDYAIADTVLAAAGLLRERRPANNAFAVKVGYPTLVSFGGSSLTRAEWQQYSQTPD